MALEPSLALREAIVTALKAEAPLGAVQEASIFGEFPGSMPERPFIRYGEDDSRPTRVSCWQGATVAFPIHFFSGARFTDEVKAGNAAIVAALDGKVIDLGEGVRATIVWNGSQVLRDAGDANAWHGFNRFEARC